MFRLAAIFVLISAALAQKHTVEILSFTATPQRITPGSNVTLEWKTRGVETVSLDWMPQHAPGEKAHTGETSQHRGGLPPSGSLVVRPAATTRYVLTCEADSGNSCASQSVTVRVQ